MIKKLLKMAFFAYLLIFAFSPGAESLSCDVPGYIAMAIKAKNLSAEQIKVRNDKFIEFLFTFSNANERNLAFLDLCELDAKAHHNVKSKLDALYVAKIVILSRKNCSLFYSDQDHTLALVGFSQDDNFEGSAQFSHKKISSIFLFALCPFAENESYNHVVFKALDKSSSCVASLNGDKVTVLNIN